MEYQKITNLLDTTFNNVPKFITIKWIEVHDQSGSAEDRSKPSKQVRFKTSVLRSDVCDAYMMHILLFKEVSTARIIQKQQEVYGIITEMNQTEEQKEINYSTKDSKSFGYKTNITWRLEGNDTEKEVAIVVPWKHLSNVWRTLDIPLFNCEINLILIWSENCVVARKATRGADPVVNPAVAAVNNPTNSTFKIKDMF